MLGGKPFRWTAPFHRRELRMKPQVDEALRIIEGKGYLRIIVTNQPDVATKNIDLDEFVLMMRYFECLNLTDILVCLHAPGGGCACRKPSPGMLLEAGQRHGIDFSRSYMIGDSETDIEAGKAAGTKTILVTPHLDAVTGAGHRVMNLMEAAALLPQL